MFFVDNPIVISKVHNIILYEPGKLFQHCPLSLPTHELHCSINGENEMHFDNQTYHIKAGMLYYLPKGTDNKEYTMFSSADYKVYTIYFDAISPMPQEPIIWNSSTSEIEILFSNIFKTWVRRPENSQYTYMKLFYNIWESIIHLNTQYLSTKQTAKLQASVDYMQKHYCDLSFDYDEMHSRSGLSYSYYKRLFIKKFGLPPVKYVTQLKLIRACELLNTPEIQYF